jgi:methionyl-tRNA formyltransferase
LKIVFIGGIKFSHALLSTILENNFDVKAVFSYDVSKKTLHSDYASFDSISEKYNILLKKITNINDPENIEILEKIKPDIILVLGWSQIIKSEILSIPKIAVIGSHPTELPKYRGRAPIPWSIIKGLKQSALTLFYIDEGTDHGDILDQVKFSIEDSDDANTIYKKITKIGKDMILRNLTLLERNTANRIKQDESKFIENWKKRTPDDGLIDWNSSAEKIHTLIRATTHPYPGAFTEFKNQKLIIWKSEFLNNSIAQSSSNPGIVEEINNDNILVGTGKGILKILKISYQDGNELNKIFSTSDIGTKLGL